ncbi:pentapeptide repeat-containing protein [Streptosporangium algeriense]|uniref:Pentapeptide repeat-containing protein n=1 Tax=Streptosporangium algeriense TaxID=1682748 RepID=A0ABW3DVV7_9ACTN
MPWASPSNSTRQDQTSAVPRAAAAGASTPATGRDPHEELQVRLTAQRILEEHLRNDRTPEQRTTEPANPRFWEGTRIDLTGATLTHLNFDHCHIAEADFATSTFTGRTMFLRTTFTGDVEFGGATFTGPVGFGGATFSGYAWFHETTFTGMAWFRQTTFTENVEFSRATFTRGAGLDEANFTGDAEFHRTAFIGTAGFSRATFTRGARFDEVAFTGDVPNLATGSGGQVIVLLQGRELLAAIDGVLHMNNDLLDAGTDAARKQWWKGTLVRLFDILNEGGSAWRISEGMEGLTTRVDPTVGLGQRLPGSVDPEAG